MDVYVDLSMNQLLFFISRLQHSDYLTELHDDIRLQRPRLCDLVDCAWMVVVNMQNQCVLVHLIQT